MLCQGVGSSFLDLACQNSAALLIKPQDSCARDVIEKKNQLWNKKLTRARLHGKICSL